MMSSQGMPGPPQPPHFPQMGAMPGGMPGPAQFQQAGPPSAGPPQMGAPTGGMPGGMPGPPQFPQAGSPNAGPSQYPQMGAMPGGMPGPPQFQQAGPPNAGPPQMGAPTGGMPGPPQFQQAGPPNAGPPQMGAPTGGMPGPPQFPQAGSPNAGPSQYPQMGAMPGGMPGPPQFQQAGPPNAGPPQYPQMGAPPGGMPGPPQFPQAGPPNAGPPQYPQMGAPPGGMPGPPQFQQAGPPPLPGQMPNAYPNAAYPPQRPQQRLDPTLMPSFVQVVEDDRNLHSNNFFNTGYPVAEQPPLVTTEFLANDTGNANPKFLRSSLYAVPNNQDMIKSAMLPFSLSITPFAELHPQEVPPYIVDHGESGPVRCQRCKAYISPFMEFIDGGRKFRCPICRSNTTVADTYFAHLDHTGRRTDTSQRPELCFGSYEFVATKEYCNNKVAPNEPAFIFLLDVSYNSVRNGLLDLFCNSIMDILRDLPREFGEPRSKIKVALATYDHSIHFYDLDSGDKPTMCIESDVGDVFVPFIEGFFVDFETAEANLEKCLKDIRSTFAETRVTETILGPAIQVGLEALKLAQRNGKIFIFHTNLPTIDAPGQLKNREDRKLLGTDKENTVLNEAIPFYKNLGQECVKNGVGVDIFLFPNAHVDVASIAPVATLSGGSVYRYQYFDAPRDGARFIADLRKDVTRPIVFDVMMRVRTSMGLVPYEYFGAFYSENIQQIQMGAMDCDKSVQLEVKYNDKLNEERCYIQVATLFTSCGGKRRLRINNLTLNVTSDYNSLYRSADQTAVFAHFLKQAQSVVRKENPKKMREQIVNICAHILASYREKCSENSPIGQLILPEGLKLLPLICSCISKSEALSGGGELNVDDRAWMMHLVPSLKVDDALRFLYPTILPISGLSLENPEEELPTPVAIRASMEFFDQNEAYLIENGILCFVWVGSGVSPEWISDVFNAKSLETLDTESGIIPERDNARSRAVRQIVGRLNAGRSRQLKTYVVKPRDMLEAWMKKFLVEDRYAENASYVEFLCDVHREIRALLS